MTVPRTDDLTPFLRSAVPQDPILHDFARLLALHGERPLVVSPTRQTTVDEIHRQAGSFGTVLPSLPPGALVALSAANGPAFLAAYLALRRRRLVPLLLDALAPAAERLAIGASLGAAGMLSTDNGWARSAHWTAIAATGAAVEPLALSPALGAVKLTSGSTGKPRGIAVPTEALAADDDQLALSMGLRATDRALAQVALSHSYGFSSLVLPALRRGALLIVPDGRGPLDPLAAARACEATFLPSVPVWLDALTRLGAPLLWPASLRLVISAGAPLPAATAERFRKAFGLPVHVFYGASECGGIAYDREGGAASRGTVGEPVAGVTITLDRDGLAVVSSAAVASGYLPEPDERLANGSFTTGDLAAWEGRELALRGRADDLIIVKGKNVNPREIETLLRQLPGIDDVAAIGVPSAGDVGESVRAVVACAAGAVTYEAVTAHCREHLVDYKVPRSVIFVAALPRTSRGKVDREALLAMVAG
jgi:long-chain acyl-CoA synthetase